MTDRSLLLRAAALLDREAQALEECHTDPYGTWIINSPADRQAQQDHAEMTAIAMELQREAGE